MNKLPNNPYVLLSIINMKLRDFYSSIDDLCDDLDENKEEIDNILNSIETFIFFTFCTFQFHIPSDSAIE